jgi:hypothetical protein
MYSLNGGEVPIGTCIPGEKNRPFYLPQILAKAVCFYLEEQDELPAGLLFAA